MTAPPIIGSDALARHIFQIGSYVHRYPLVFLDERTALSVHDAIHCHHTSTVTLFDHITKCDVQMPIMTTAAGLRYIVLNGGITFVEQNRHKRDSEWARRALEGHSITWIIAGGGTSMWGRIVNDRLEQASSVLNGVVGSAASSSSSSSSSTTSTTTTTSSTPSASAPMLLSKQRRQHLAKKLQRPKVDMEHGGNGDHAGREREEDAPQCNPVSAPSVDNRSGSGSDNVGGGTPDEDKSEDGGRTLQHHTQDPVANLSLAQSPPPKDPLPARQQEHTTDNNKDCQQVRRRFGRPTGIIRMAPLPPSTAMPPHQQPDVPCVAAEMSTQESNIPSQEYGNGDDIVTDEEQDTPDHDMWSEASSFMTSDSDNTDNDEDPIASGSPPFSEVGERWARKVNFVKILESAMRQEYAEPFVIDPKVIPGYNEIFPRERQMWLQRMMRKAKNLEYSYSTDLMRDMDILVANCAKFNSQESEYTRMAEKLSFYVNKLIDDDLKATETQQAKKEATSTAATTTIRTRKRITSGRAKHV